MRAREKLESVRAASIHPLSKRHRGRSLLEPQRRLPTRCLTAVLKKERRCASGSTTCVIAWRVSLCGKGQDVKTVQKMLRHSDVSTTLGIYGHSMSEDRLAAQDDMLAAMMTPSNAVN